jgi:alpha-glucosidase (family GH31 glycosyl hydrolase)
MNEISNLNRKEKCPGEIFDIKDKIRCDINEDLKISYLPGYTNNINVLTTGSINMNAITYKGTLIYDNKPLISVYQSRQTYNYLKKQDRRPFILSRSNSFGSGKYSFHWLGDNFSSNKYIKYSIAGIFNYNIFGIPFTGADICGFNYNAYGTLCARWYNIGAFYPFSRNHNSKRYIDQYPWSFNENVENIIKKDIQYRYSLLRYFYSQLFLVSLNEKGSFFKPLMFEFPEEENSYQNIESKIMFGEAFLICAFYERNEGAKKFYLPNNNFNEFPSGNTIINYGDENRIIELSGKLDKLYIFLRGGYIVPYQNVFNKYILNSVKLRDEKLNLIINPNDKKESKGVLFFDNDDINTIEKNIYFRINMFFRDKKLAIKCDKNNIDKYNYNDHILEKIEFWRANEIFELKDNNEVINIDSININIYYNDKSKKEENINGFYERGNNKIIFDLSKNGKKISIFDINEILFNYL